MAVSSRARATLRSDEARKEFCVEGREEIRDGERRGGEVKRGEGEALSFHTMTNIRTHTHTHTHAMQCVSVVLFLLLPGYVS